MHIYTDDTIIFIDRLHRDAISLVANEYSWKNITDKVENWLFVLVRGPELHDLPQFVKDGVRHIHGAGPHTAAEHADCHDGQHLRARDRAKREGVCEASKYLQYTILLTK